LVSTAFLRLPASRKERTKIPLHRTPTDSDGLRSTNSRRSHESRRDTPYGLEPPIPSVLTVPLRTRSARTRFKMRRLPETAKPAKQLPREPARSVGAAVWRPRNAGPVDAWPTAVSRVGANEVLQGYRNKSSLRFECTHSGHGTAARLAERSRPISDRYRFDRPRQADLAIAGRCLSQRKGGKPRPATHPLEDGERRHADDCARQQGRGEVATVCCKRPKRHGQTETAGIGIPTT
jgi:hypothetical protein